MKRRKRKIRWDRIFMLGMTILSVWLFASFIDVNIHTYPDANYGKFASWNIIIPLVDLLFGIK